MNYQNNEAILINNETVLPFDYFNDDTLELTNCADNETTKYFSFKIFIFSSANNFINIFLQNKKQTIQFTVN